MGRSPFRHVLLVIKWTMLASSTIGPGSVIMCSTAGAEFKMSLVWCIPFAASMGFAFQELVGRIVIKTQAGLGSAMRQRLVRHAAGAAKARGEWACRAMAVCGVIGVTFWECNNMACGLWVNGDTVGGW